jgi:enamine deaminase RidA (YjgF/YER057c/UK114 family)
LGQRFALVGFPDGLANQDKTAQQDKQAFANLNRALIAGGSSLNNVAKVTIFLTDISDFGEVSNCVGSISPNPIRRIALSRGPVSTRSPRKSKLKGLATAYNNYEQHLEQAWK